MSLEPPTEPFDHADHAKHAAHSGDPFLARVSVTIAILAVAAATVGSFETIETAHAISDKNQAVLYQDQATDSWNFYQARSIKKNMYEIAAITNQDRKEEFDKIAQQNAAEQDGIRSKAERFQEQSAESLKESAHHERRHHVLTFAVTVLHVSIAIATLSIIIPGERFIKRVPWYASMILGVIGVISAFGAYLV
jgi:uncharacterized membrane protein